MSTVNIPRAVASKYKDALRDFAIRKAATSIDSAALDPQVRVGDTLRQALKLVEGERNEAYGDAYDLLDHAARIYKTIRGHGGMSIPPIEGAYYMLALKLAREQHAHGRDNWIDVAGYADIAQAIIEQTIQRIRREIAISPERLRKTQEDEGQ